METSLLGKATGGRSKWGVVKKSLSNLKDRDVVVPAGEPKSPVGAGPSGAASGGGDVTKSEHLGSSGGRDEVGPLPRLLPKSMPLVEGQGGATARPPASKGPMTVRLEGPPRSNRAKMARQSVILCMDPNCNRCPPEMHMHMRKTMAPTSAPQPKPAKPKFNFNMADFEDEEEEEEEEVDEEEWVMVTVRCCGLKITYRRQLYFWRNFFSQFILPPVFSPHNKYVRMWMRGLIYISLVSFFTDPFFLFALSVDPDTYCIYTKNNWVYTLCAVRSFIDFVTLINMVLHSRLAFNATQLHLRGNKILNRWGEPVKLGELVIDDEKAILYNYVRHFFVYDVLCLIPLPQIVYLGVLPYIPAQQVASTWVVLLRLSVLLQFVPRIIRLYPVFSGTGGYQFVAESAWASFLLNLFTFSISSHVVGSVWYLLVVQRVSFCLNTVCIADGPQTCSMDSLSCQYYGIASPLPNAGPNSYDSNLQMCLNGTDPVQPYGNSTSQVAFGMYSSGVQTTTTPVLLAQWLYALMWGFQQISTFAGNLVATTYIGEVLFMLFVMVLGIFLFALLIGNMQNFLQGLSRRSMEHQLHLRDVEKWMEQRDIPRDIQKRVRQLDRYVWSVNQGVNEEEVLSSLTEDIRRDVRRHLCLELIKKSRLFSAMDDMVQDAICDRLRQCLFIDKTVVIREGSPVSRMFFVLRGALESSTTNKGRTGFFESQFLSKGDFFGEELLVYFIEKYAGEKSRKSMGRSVRREVKTSSLLPDLLPKSERTVVCMGPVDGFTLEAADIDFVCTQFFRVMQSDKIQRALNVCSINRRTRAATTIQVWYRARVRRQLSIPLDIFRQAVRTRRIGPLLRQAKAAAEGNPDGVPPPVPSSEKKKKNSGGLDSGSSQKGVPKSGSSKRSPNTSSEMPKGTKKTGRSGSSSSNNSSSDEGGRPTLVHSATTASPGGGEGGGSLFGKLVSFGRTVSAEEPEGGGALSSASPAIGGGSGAGGGSGRLPRSSTDAPARGIVGRLMGSASRASASPSQEEPDEPAKKFEFQW